MRNSIEEDEKWADPGYSLMAELTAFSHRLVVGYGRRSGVEGTLHSFGLSNRKLQRNNQHRGLSTVPGMLLVSDQLLTYLDDP